MNLALMTAVVGAAAAAPVEVSAPAPLDTALIERLTGAKGKLDPAEAAR